jgi:hypothetical protein
LSESGVGNTALERVGTVVDVDMGIVGWVRRAYGDKQVVVFVDRNVVWGFNRDAYDWSSFRIKHMYETTRVRYINLSEGINSDTVSCAGKSKLGWIGKYFFSVWSEHRKTGIVRIVGYEQIPGRVNEDCARKQETLRGPGPGFEAVCANDLATGIRLND